MHVCMYVCVCVCVCVCVDTGTATWHIWIDAYRDLLDRWQMWEQQILKTVKYPIIS
jgi:hypothetical protein